MCVCVCVCVSILSSSLSTDYKGVFNVLIFNDWKILKLHWTFSYRDLFVMCKKKLDFIHLRHVVYKNK